MTPPAPVIGITGCGSIGALHAGNLQRRGVALRFHSRTPARARALAGRVGGTAVDTYAELLAHVDAVLVATPPEHHTGAVLAALARGCGVLVEKPLCLTRSELAQIEAAAARAQAFVMVAENYYYKPSTRLLREVLTWGGVGRVGRMCVGKRTRQAAAGWRAAYGALLEGGIHFVALVGDLIDAALAPGEEEAPVVEPEVVAARFPTWDGRPERQSILRLAQGELRADLHYAWDMPARLKGIGQQCRIDGEEGRVLFECNGIYVDVRGPGRRGLSFPGVRDLMGYGAMTDDFLACVSAPGHAPYSNLLRARRDLSIIWRAYEQLPAASGAAAVDCR